MIEIKNVTFTYRSSDDAGTTSPQTASIHDLSLSVPDGQFVVLCGESGCGKTTVTRLINGLIPHYYEGELSGSIEVNGSDIAKQPLYDTAKTVGSVFQDPRSQFFNVDTTSEITFGCENLGMPEETILERLDETTEALDLRNLLDRSIFHLSGGEKQRIACAGVSVMEPDVLVLDEPSSNLDAQSVMDLRRILAKWKSEGRTVIISEHRLYYLHGIADRFIYICDGCIDRDMTADEFCSLSPDVRRSMGLRAPDMQSLFHGSDIKSNASGAQLSEAHTSSPSSVRYDQASISGKSMALRDFRFSYKNRHPVLDIADCEIPAGMITAIIGSNGAGKSTFARCFCGLEKRCGTVISQDRKLRPKDRLNTCYMVLQDAGHQLFTESVLDEVLISLDRKDLQELSLSHASDISPDPAAGNAQTTSNATDPAVRKAEEILASLDLLQFKDRHPASLSGGQKQRLAIATSVASKRSILFFDEPTSGLDYRHMLETAAFFRKLQASGHTIYVVTHDPEFIIECCTDIIRLKKGRITELYAMNDIGAAKIRRFFSCR